MLCFVSLMWNNNEGGCMRLQKSVSLLHIPEVNDGEVSCS